MTSSDLGGSQTGTWRPVARLLNTMRTPLARDSERMVAVAQLWVSTWGGIPWQYVELHDIMLQSAAAMLLTWPARYLLTVSWSATCAPWPRLTARSATARQGAGMGASVRGRSANRCKVAW